ncbi:MAG: NAD-dependent epimerase/dehydratase family protein [Pseudomonadales bacterium]
MIVAITGGRGFIGLHLVAAHLAQGDKVRLLSRTTTPIEGVEVYVGDLTSKHVKLDTFIDNVDVIYHCAGEITNEATMHVLHVDGTRRLLKASTGKVGRWVQLSSVGAYGPKRIGLIGESTSENPKGNYENTKTIADALLHQFARKAGMDYVILRPSIVFGSAMTNRSLASMVHMLKRGLFFYIGKGDAVVNYIHVSYVVKALMHCATHAKAPGHTFIISEYTSIQKMVQALCKGIEAPEPHLSVPEPIARFIAKSLGWAKCVPLTLGRVDAMTNHCIYDASKIEQTLGLNASGHLAIQFTRYARSVLE